MGHIFDYPKYRDGCGSKVTEQTPVIHVSQFLSHGHQHDPIHQACINDRMQGFARPRRHIDQQYIRPTPIHTPNNISTIGETSWG